jgi:hypothetical protein
VQQTEDGGFLIAGSLGIDLFNRDIWMIKLNANGDSIWTKTFGGPNWDIGRSMEPTNDGGYVICGDYYSSGTNNYDIWLLKTEAEPNIIELKENSSPALFILKQNYPNPFNPGTKIIFIVPSNIKGEMSNVSLKVYDVLGNEVATLVNGELPAGEYEVTFDVSQISNPVLTSGLYLYQLMIRPSTSSGRQIVLTKKMMLLK